MSTGYAVESAKIPRPRNNNMSLKQRIRNWLFDERESSVMIDQPIATNNIESDGMRFQLYKATNGYIVETRSYERKLDRSSNKLYIIRDDQDIGEEIGKIITMECLR